MKEGTLQVVTYKGGYDCINKAYLSYHIKRGYVVALYPGETKLSLEECEELARQGIAVIYDGDKKQIIFKLEA